MARREALRNSEIDQFIDDDGFILSDSDSNIDDSLVFNIDDVFLSDSSSELSDNGDENHSVVADGDAEFSQVNNDDLDGNTDKDDNIPEQNVGLPVNIVPVVDIINEHVVDIVNKVAIGEIGLWNYPQWKDEPNEPKHIVFYGENVGVNIPNKDTIDTELECFEHFFTNEIVEHIVEQTNLYAAKCLADDSRPKRKDDTKWVETTANEMKSFFALIIIMAVVQKPTLQSYWTKTTSLVKQLV